MVATKTQNVLSICVHYDDIVNYPFKESDELTKVIIDQYESKIFDIDGQDFGKTNQIKVIDIVVYDYLINHKFNNYVRNDLNFENIPLKEENLVDQDLVTRLIKLHKQYRDKKENEKENTRWL